MISPGSNFLCSSFCLLKSLILPYSFLSPASVILALWYDYAFNMPSAVLPIRHLCQHCFRCSLCLVVVFPQMTLDLSLSVTYMHHSICIRKQMVGQWMAELSVQWKTLEHSFWIHWEQQVLSWIWWMMTNCQWKQEQQHRSGWQNEKDDCSNWLSLSITVIITIILDCVSVQCCVGVSLPSKKTCLYAISKKIAVLCVTLQNRLVSAVGWRSTAYLTEDGVSCRLKKKKKLAAILIFFSIK